jgi:hypothetical protein
MRKMLIDEPVHDLTPVPFTMHDTGGLEDTQMLADQGLRHTERVDQLMDTSVGLAQLENDRDAYRRRQCPQQVTRGGECARGASRGRFGRLPLVLVLYLGAQVRRRPVQHVASL